MDNSILAQEKMLHEIEESIKQTSSLTGVSALSPSVLQALKKVPRHEFVGSKNLPFAYLNEALSIGAGQTISQPFIVALMTQLLDVEASDRVLEIGTGSGYQAAILSWLASEVYSIEVIPILAKQAQASFHKLEYKNIYTSVGNGVEGWPEHAPYQKIIATAAADQIPPALLSQLDASGKLVIPLRKTPNSQVLVLVSKSAGGKLSMKESLPVVFVPFV